MRLALKCALVVTGLLAAEWAAGDRVLTLGTQPSDPRLPVLRLFFASMNSPAYSFAEEFLSASDRFGLDWRLLPSLSILESGGGREGLNNNILGWDSCRQKFPSVAIGIHYVANRLAESNCYKGKNLDQVLRAYNQDPDYPRRARALMVRLGPDRSSLPSGR